MATAIRSSPASVALTAMISCLTRVAYSGRFRSWDQTELRNLETPLNSLLRRLSGFSPSTATQLLYIAPSQGGMGFTSLCDFIQKRKSTLVHRLLLLPSSASNAMGGLLTRAARFGGYPTRPGEAYTRLQTQHPIHPSWDASLGALASDTYARLGTGLPLETLDQPVLPLENCTRSVIHRLKAIGPLLWGDLTSCTQGIPPQWYMYSITCGQRTSCLQSSTPATLRAGRSFTP